jgi:glutamine amidotransferase
LLNIDRLVIPGVGAFPRGMEKLKLKNYLEPILKYAGEDKPILAICLGMQLLMEEGEEHEVTKGLGLIAGKVVPIPEKITSLSVRKIPHIGWNALNFPINAKNENEALFLNTLGKDMYFVHSYVVEVADKEFVVGTTNYEDFQFCSVVRQKYIVGCQFHPEKSGTAGLNFLRNFMQI